MFKKLKTRSAGKKGVKPSFNLISEFHLDNKKMYENAHTRVLVAILKYDTRFLSSLLLRCGIKQYISEKRINIEAECQFSKNSGRWTKTKTWFDKEDESHCRPDGLIWKEGKFAIIIENKINSAPETKHQIDNYISAVKDEFKVKEESIWVVYLGGDSVDVPSETSLSIYGKPFLKESRKMNRQAGKHLCLESYKDDILPWLEEDVLPNCPYGMTGLTGGILVYIDYLKKRFWDKDTEENRFYDSEEVIKFFNNMEDDSPYYIRYMDAHAYIGLAPENDPSLSFFKALKHYYLHYHFRFENDLQLNETWAIRAVGSYVYVWKKSWERIQIKQRPTCDLFFELFPYQVDQYKANLVSHKGNNNAITCRLGYKSNDTRLATSLKQEGVIINEHIYSKKTGKILTLDGKSPFFEQLVTDPALLDQCEKIEKAIKNYAKL